MSARPAPLPPTHTRGSSSALLRPHHSMLPSAGSPIPKPPEPDPLCCPVKVGDGVHSFKGCRLLSGWASSPSLSPPWMAHLCPLSRILLSRQGAGTTLPCAAALMTQGQLSAVGEGGRAGRASPLHLHHSMASSPVLSPSGQLTCALVTKLSFAVLSR